MAAQGSFFEKHFAGGWEALRARSLHLTRQQVLAAVGLGSIIVLAVFLRFYQLGVWGVGNAYYAATVKSMLTSWRNFFYVSFEPGGSVSVDKPPLGFWIQALSAAIFGLNGFALALPQALAGALSIPLLYSMVKRPFGAWAGLLSALALAVMPITIAAERNNTQDGLLVFLLLLAAWAALKAARQGQLRYLLLSMFLVGLGFNIKMLQAFMALPALVAVYFFGAKIGWRRRILHLAAAAGLLLVVSFAWVAAVELTPAAGRPYVGSSTNNSMLELVIGHNGLERLGLSDSTIVNGAVSSTGSGQPGAAMNGARGFPGQGGAPGGSSFQQPPAGASGPPPDGGFGQPPAGFGGGGPGGPGGDQVGTAGILRLFTQPLADQAGWLLPLALLGIPVAGGVLWRRRKAGEQGLSLLLWAAWLLPMMAYFSFTTGLWHAYYLVMLGPAIAALVGAAAWGLAQVLARRRRAGFLLAALLTGVTAAFEMVTVRQYPAYALPVLLLTAAAWLAGLGWLAWRQFRMRPAGPTIALLWLCLVVAPFTLSALTTFNPSPNTALPVAEASTSMIQGPEQAGDAAGQTSVILAYLEANTQSNRYLVATYNANEAAPYILATGRPVLTFGGFLGNDAIVSAAELAQMVSSGELRYVLGGQQGQGKADISAWVSQNCTAVQLSGAAQSTAGPHGSPTTLYDCAAKS